MTPRRKIKAAGTARNRRSRRRGVKRSLTGSIGFAPPAELTAAVERIIEAVGKEPDDRRKLAADIEQADDQYSIIAAAQAARLSKRRRRTLESISKHIEKAAALINADPVLKEAINEAWTNPFSSSRVEELRDTVRFCLTKAGRRQPSEERRLNKTELIAGVILPRVFAKRFGLPIRFSRDVDGPCGPVVDFVEATMKEMRLPYSRESIAKAINNARVVGQILQKI